MIWKMVCKHLVFLEEKEKMLKVMGDAFNIQVLTSGINGATNIAYLKSLDSCRKESLLPGIVLREYFQ